MKTSCHVPPPIQQFPIESFLKSWPLLIFTSWCIKALSLPTAHCANLGAIPSTSFLPNQLLFLFHILFYTNYKICPATCHSTILIPEVALNVCIQTDSNSQAVNLIFLSTSELTKQGCAVNINDVGLF